MVVKVTLVSVGEASIVSVLGNAVVFVCKDVGGVTVNVGGKGERDGLCKCAGNNKDSVAATNPNTRRVTAPPPTTKTITPAVERLRLISIIGNI